MKFIYSSSLLFLVVLSQCQDDVGNSSITKVSLGTSFGMCMGFCTQTVTFEESIATKELIQRGDDVTKSCTIPIDFNNLAQKIDMESFGSLPKVIGCPDCADGGSEWIEITTVEGTMRVTYEFGKEPVQVQSFITELRKYYDLLAECD